MLVKDIEKIIIISPFGYRTRNLKKEFHPGIDIRVYNQDIDPNARNILPIVAPEKMTIERITFDPNWGHFIFAKPVEENELGIVEFRFFHQVPVVDCIANTLFDKDVIISNPERGYVDLHLHFGTMVIDSRTGQLIPSDPLEYLTYISQEYEFKQ